MIRQTIYASLLILGFFSRHDTNAQVRTTYDALSDAGGRAHAMGNAMVAEARDASAIYVNPAALSFLRSALAFIDHQFLVDHRAMRHTLGFVATVGGQNRFGLSISYAQNGRMLRQAQNTSAGSHYSVHLAQSILLARSIAAGVSASIQTLNAPALRMTRVAGVLGFLYAPSREISYGLALGGFALQSTITQEVSPDEVWKAPAGNLGIGISMRFPSLHDPQTFTLSLSNEKQFGTPGLTYRVGMEYHLLPAFAIRVGAFTGPSQKGGTVGFGLRILPFLIDIAYTPSQGEHVYQISGYLRL